MKRLKSITRKILATFLFSILASIAAIIHGTFFDLDMAQIRRLSFEGFLLTFLIVFPSLLLLEWIFDLENHEEFRAIEQRVSKLEKGKK